MKQLLHFFIIALISSYSISQNLKSPSEFLGYEIGTEYSRHSQVIDYFEYVTKQMSENVILNQMSQATILNKHFQTLQQKKYNNLKITIYNFYY